MTAFTVEIGDDQVYVASDSLQYSLAGTYAPVGMAQKIIPTPGPGLMLAKGTPEIALRAALALAEQGEEFGTADDVVAALPGLLRRYTAAVAHQRGIRDPSSLMLLEVMWVGWSERLGKFEVTMFRNYERDFAPKRDYAGNVSFFVSPQTPPQYAPANFNKITDPEARAVAAMRSVQRFTHDHGKALGMPPIGGPVQFWELTRDGFCDHGLIDDLGAPEATMPVEDLAAGHDLVHTVAEAQAASGKLQQIMTGSAPTIATIAPVALNWQQRRAMEKAQKKTGSRAA